LLHTRTAIAGSATPPPRAAAEGEPVAEAVLSLALLHALQSLQSAAAPLRQIRGGGHRSGPPMVVCVGEAALRVAPLRALGISLVWVEV